MCPGHIQDMVNKQQCSEVLHDEAQGLLCHRSPPDSKIYHAMCRTGGIAHTCNVQNSELSWEQRSVRYGLAFKSVDSR